MKNFIEVGYYWRMAGYYWRMAGYYWRMAGYNCMIDFKKGGLLI
jgi:hypothetical protein